MIDGIDQLISLYSDSNTFVKAFLDSTLFLPVDVVQARTQEMIDLYKTGGKFPVRYSPSHNEELKTNNKAEAIIYTRHQEVRTPRYPSFNIKIDNDGNHENRRQMKLRLNQTISMGKNSTIKNYIISHVWGLASHPLFFSSLWNIVLIPAHFNYLMDKDPASHEVVKIIKEKIQQKCIILYQPYKNLIPHIPEIEEFKDLLFRDAESQGGSDFYVHFLTSEGIEQQRTEVTLTEDERDLLEILLGRMGKKFFVDYYEPYINGEDLMKVIPIGIYTYGSVMTRVSTMRKIFNEGLNAKALAYILENENSRLDDKTIELARDLMELS
jgi:hypothetical protein